MVVKDLDVEVPGPVEVATAGGGWSEVIVFACDATATAGKPDARVAAAERGERLLFLSSEGFGRCRFRGNIMDRFWPRRPWARGCAFDGCLTTSEIDPAVV